MASADGVIKISTDVDDKGLKSGLSGLSSKASGLMAGLGKAAVAGITASAVAVTALVKKSVDAYSEFEQLRGGVEMLYKDSANEMLNYANNAYKTSQMSANQFLTIATSFSAALINDLGGDTSKAAEITNRATMAIADNWAAMGGDLERIQLAFQGFARGQYVLLDNLKLGYGGTKEEMERLVKDANEYAKSIGQAGDLSMDSFADQIRAIELIQQKLGIAGQAQREAAHTIQGSLAMTKAAWENLITGLSDSSADIDQLVQNFTVSLGNLISNLIPTIMQALVGLSQALPQVVESLFSSIDEVIQNSLPGLIEAVLNLLYSFMTLLPNLLMVIVDSLPQIMDAIIEGLRGFLPRMFEFGVEFFHSLVEAIPMSVTMLQEQLPELINVIITSLAEGIPQMIIASQQLFLALVQAIPTIIQTLVNNLPQIITAIISGLLAHLPELIVGSVQLFMALIIAIPQIIVELIKAIPQIITGIVNGLIQGIPRLIQAAAELWNGFIGYVSQIPGRMVEIGSNIVRGIWDGIHNMIDWVLDKIRGFGESVVHGMMSIFGIQSPSKVMRDLVGINLARGIVQGFFEEDPMGQIRDGIEAGVGNLSANLSINAERRSMATQEAVVSGGGGISLTFNDVQTDPDSIYQKFRQQSTYGLARAYG